MIVPMENITNDEDIELKKASTRRPRHKATDQKESFGDRFKNRFQRKESQVLDHDRENLKSKIKEALLLVCSVAAVVAGVYGAYVIGVWALTLLVTGIATGAFGVAIGGWFALGLVTLPIYAGFAVGGMCFSEFQNVAARREARAQELKTAVA